uniref:SUEL-type lectin domain-containing protein n=1 Tax=Salix viminalis TaxID=40686 RepID=A0A6N2MV05_SALVM
MDDVNVALQQDGNYSLLVSILQDCNQEIYNTAKVKPKHFSDDVFVFPFSEFNVQTSGHQSQLKAALLGRGGFKATQLLEQKAQQNDQSDYLWYMTRVVNNGTSMKNVTLRVKYSGQFLQRNDRSLLCLSPGETLFPCSVLLLDFRYCTYSSRSLSSSASISITIFKFNEGILTKFKSLSYFSSQNYGIAGGPVELIDSGITTDLSSNEWSYKVGLIGEGRRFYNPHSGHAKWVSGNLPVGSAMTWYKAPSGTEPVVVDLQGMGKGHAWVNGNSLGRFWPTLTADPNGCDGKCDYRGQYKENKCLSNCGNPTQRWYCKFYPMIRCLKDGTVLSGTMSKIFTATETICGNAYEGTTLELSCNGGRRTISDIQFASFGDPQGSTCGSFQRGSVEASSSLSAVEKACLGKESCSINVSKTTLWNVYGDQLGR